MCLQFDDRILASGSYDTTIKIWDLESAKEIRTLRGHTSGIRCLQFDDTKLISGSLDHTLKIWDWRTGNCLRTYTGHADGVICLHFDSKLLVSGSIDKTVRVWNFEDKSTSVLRGHDDWVNSVKIDKGSRTLFSASDDLTVRLWDLDTNTTLRIFKGHVGQVQQVLPLPHDFELTADDGATESDEHDDSSSRNGLPNGIVTPPPSTNGFYGSGFADMTRRLPPRYMLTGALDSTIRLWDVATGKCLRTFFGHVEGVWDLAADSLRMVSGSEDRTLKIWDPRTGDCEGTFTGHTGPVTCVGLSDSRIATGSEDSEVRMYSFKSDDGSFGTGRPEVSEATMVH
jgi:F-box/WD-40 domain protein MET30